METKQFANHLSSDSILRFISPRRERLQVCVAHNSAQVSRFTLLILRFLITAHLSTLYIIAFFHRAALKRVAQCAWEFSASKNIISIRISTTFQLFFQSKLVLNTASVSIVIQVKLCAVSPAKGRIIERAVILNWILTFLTQLARDTRGKPRLRFIT